MNTITPTTDMGRIHPDDINPDLCIARHLPDVTIPGYTPKVYREAQCGFVKRVGNLCNSHHKAREKAKALGEDFQCHKAGHGRWFGLITENPPPTCHMLGTDWAEKKVTKVDEAVVPVPAPVPAPVPVIEVMEMPNATEELVAVRQELATMRQELVAVRQELAAIVSKNNVVVEVRLA
jgi:hypothetical protein